MCDLSGCAIHDNILIIGLFGKSKILKIDIESGEANVLTTNGITVGNLIFYNDSVWIVSSDGEKCSKITEDGNTLCEYNLCESNIKPYEDINKTNFIVWFIYKIKSWFWIFGTKDK